MTEVTDQASTETEQPAVPLEQLRPALEAVLMVADEPLDPAALAAAVGHPTVEVVAALSGLAAEYAEQGRGFDLRNVGGGWRYYTRSEYADVVGGFVLEGQQARLTQAALETLAVVAYKQPVSRARVSAIRGVNVDGVMRTLLARGLVEEAGQDGETGANLYITTAYFLERIGITSLEELPELAPYLPDMDELEDELEKISEPAAAAGADETAPDDGPVDGPIDEKAAADAAEEAEARRLLASAPVRDEEENEDDLADDLDDAPADDLDGAPADAPEMADDEPTAGLEEPDDPDVPDEDQPEDQPAEETPAIDLANLPKPDDGPVEGRLKDQFPGLFR